MTLTKHQFLQQMERRGAAPASPVILPFRMVAGVPVIKANINGHGLEPMMLDTGASRTMIQATMAVEKKVPVLRAEEATVEMQGVIGREVGRIGLLNSLILGDWTLRSYPCLVRTYENRLKSRQGGAKAFPESLLGFDVALNQCSFLTLDYRTGKVTFGFHRAFQPRSTDRLAKTPFKVKHGVPFITVKSGDHSWEAIVDTGSFNGIEISEEIATRLGVQNQGKKIRGLYLMAVGGTVTSAQANMRVVKLKDLTLVGERYQEAEVDIAPGPPRVGSFFLKDYRATFDFRRKILWLEW